jgi:hypothetical protein
MTGARYKNDCYSAETYLPYLLPPIYHVELGTSSHTLSKKWGLMLVHSALNTDRQLPRIKRFFS